MSANATAVIGVLVGFLIVGVIGVYVGSEMISAAELDNTSELYTAQQTVIETFELGVTLCKIVVIVSVAAIVFMLLQQIGLIPRFGPGGSQ